MKSNTKQDLRERILTLLRNQGEEERVKKSLVILDKLIVLPEFKDASTILFYASFGGEVDTFEMMKKAQTLDKTIGLPDMDKGKRELTPRRIDSFSEDLMEGSFGIKEPKNKDRSLPLDDIDLVIVPGVAFDKHNNRLGRGGGYYDRFLAKLPADTPTVGLAFDFQIVDILPDCEEHDVAVTHVLVS